MRALLIAPFAAVAMSMASIQEAKAQEFCDSFMQSAWDICSSWEESDWPDQSQCAAETFASVCPDSFEGHETNIGRSWERWEGRIYTAFGMYGRLYTLI